MKTILSLTILVVTQCLFAQNFKTKDEAVKYIEDYYSEFKTGYDSQDEYGYGKYITLTNNYKASFSESIFTLTFDEIDYNKIENKTIIINLKEVLSLERGAIATVNIYDTDFMYSLAIAQEMEFNIADKTFKIFVNESPKFEESDIYKAFEKIIESYKK